MKEEKNDLTPFFTKAVSMKDNGGSGIDFLSVFEELLQGNQVFCDWDQGEQTWGLLLNKGSSGRIAMFHERLPLMFVDISYVSTLEGYLRKKNLDTIVLVVVEDWNKEVYTLDISKIGGSIDWHSELDPSAASINDLWYSTI